MKIKILKDIQIPANKGVMDYIKFKKDTILESRTDEDKMNNWFKIFISHGYAELIIEIEDKFVLDPELIKLYKCSLCLFEKEEKTIEPCNSCSFKYKKHDN